MSKQFYACNPQQFAAAEFMRKMIILQLLMMIFSLLSETFIEIMFPFEICLPICQYECSRAGALTANVRPAPWRFGRLSDFNREVELEGEGPEL